MNDKPVPEPATRSQILFYQSEAGKNYTCEELPDSSNRRISNEEIAVVVGSGK
jgi:hypothetical protein